MQTILIAILATLALVAVFLVLLGRRIWSLPDLSRRIDPPPAPVPEGGALAEAFGAAIAAHPGRSGVMPIPGGPGAFALRVALIRAAARRLDVQYYIWQRDVTGLLLLDELRKAADRGVSVRLLIDDNGIPALDDLLAELDAQPNAEVRLFNPFVLRRPKALNYLFDFPRLNRRMHNKSLTADGIATIVGGRNIGDIYFGHGEAHYRDLDALAVGEGAAETAHDFQRYWTSASAYPAGWLLAPPRLGSLDSALVPYRAGGEVARLLAEVEARGPMDAILKGELPLDWCRVDLVSDDPRKALGDGKDPSRLLDRLIEGRVAPKRSLTLISAYFVPERRGAAYLISLARAGVRVRVLTNALESTDVTLVHSGYIRYRRALARAGVQLFELRPVLGREEARRVDTRLIGKGTASLHAKSFSADGARVFIGSYNFDQRSLNLNCENGVLIESERLAAVLEERFDSEIRPLAWEVTAAPGGGLTWTGSDGAVWRHDPGTRAGTRLLVRAASRLPIAWLL
ncbi:phospholipase D-like domain-containing protein [Wenxinia marina]|uniref:Phospholipase D n=1 Tax=Wenxinia marina DSM 24838 TaxID=1123501 RepID=A0A0D0PYU9_9RHOB|nr:phospholipase D family protein [Wenxinia marina]KIQ67589.1 Phosphatidylserine/phosphatidylglycerophosphate/cardiolipin synthase [Wenxinia marina DSM 24838]GGL68249.1 cardiolipin synthase C [Wenxinia marina]